jgi:DNA-binding SARP family transcriptional activator
MEDIVPTLTIHLFGNLHVTHNGHEPVPLKPAARSMLAFLLLYQYRHPRTTGPRRDLLASQFWANHDERAARRCLSTTLWRLRRSLEAEGLSSNDYIVTNNNDEVAFNFGSDHWLDVAAFEQKVDQGMSGPVSSMTEQDARLLEEAQVLYIGDLFEDCYDDWIFRHRERLHLKYLSCLGRLMHYYDIRGDFEKCLQYGRKILSLDPLREQIHRYMMRLYVRNGQQSLAVQQYHTCYNALKTELGIEPMAETQALFREITAGPAVSPKVAPQKRPTQLQQALLQLQEAMQALNAAQKQVEEAREMVVHLTNEIGSASP